MPESLMWYDGAGNTDGRSGPDSVFFRYTLPYTLESDELVGPEISTTQGKWQELISHLGKAIFTLLSLVLTGWT